MIEGCDYSYDWPGIPALKATGKKFVCRYLTGATDAAYGSKNLTRREADELQAAGLDLCSNYETTVGFMLEGYDSGAKRAAAAWKQHKACGGPDGRPIYFSLDMNATYNQWKQAREFLKGAASAIGWSQVGMYGGLFQVDWAHDELGMRWLWQALGWSYNQVSPHIVLRQYRNGVTLGSGTVDYDRALVDDYGQWSAKEEDVSYSQWPTADKNALMDDILETLHKFRIERVSTDTQKGYTLGELLLNAPKLLDDEGNIRSDLATVLAAVKAAGGELSPQQIQDLGNAIANALLVRGGGYTLSLTGEAVPKATQ